MAVRSVRFAEPTPAQTFPIEPFKPSPTVRQACEGLFHDSPLLKDQKEFTYSTNNDFGKKIHTLLFCMGSPGFSSHFFKNMKEIADREGFRLIPSQSVHPVRDPKLPNHKGKILEPTCSPSCQDGLDRLVRQILIKNKHSYLSKHPSFSGIIIGNVHTNKLHRRTGEGIHSKFKIDSRLYFEAGNLFHLTNKDNQDKWIIGEDLATVTHQILRKDKWFDPFNPNNPSVAHISEDTIFINEGDLLNQWFLAGEISQKIEAVSTQIETSISNSEVKAVLDEMRAMELLNKVEFGTPEEIKNGRSIACKYLAQRKFVEEQVFPIEIGTTADHVKFVKQPAYHIDLMMAPGPKGSIFLQNFGKSIDVLERVQAKALDFQLSKNEQKQLELFIETTKLLANDLQPLLDEVKTDLEKAGFIVTPTPGAFFGYNLGDSQNPLNINFLNAITGYSEKNDHIIYIASGANTKIGRILMHTYVEFLSHQTNKVAVYFVGRDPENRDEYTEAMENLSRQKAQLGPHCLSFELGIKKHTTTIT